MFAKYLHTLVAVCKYTVHERCVQRAPASCISTYVKTMKTNQKMTHHWVSRDIICTLDTCLYLR